MLANKKYYYPQYFIVYENVQNPIEDYEERIEFLRDLFLECQIWCYEIPYGISFERLTQFSFTWEKKYDFTIGEVALKSMNRKPLILN